MFARLLYLLVLLGSLVFPAPVTEQPVVLLQVDAPIIPATAGYLERGLQAAQARHAQAVILALNTPGGQIASMNRMLQAISNHDVPVIVYVSPAGAMAGSAGAIITLSGHRAAMAPHTVMGAATPVGPGGEDLGNTMRNKVEQILVASVRTMTVRRPQRAQRLAEEIITTARAVSAQEALEAGLIDYIAADVDDLLAQLDGAAIEVAGETHVLHTRNAPLVPIPMTFVESLLQLLGNPNLVFLFMVTGITGVLVEFLTPGGWVAGFLGVVSLALASYGLGILPINWFGMFFLVLAFLLFVLDVKVPTHGALTFAGVVTFIFGTLVFFNSGDTPAFQQVSVPLVVAVGIAFGGGFAILIGIGIRTTRQAPRMGTSTLLGREGIVRVPLAPKGQVRVAGELWSAEAAPGEAIPVPENTYIQVVAVKGLRLVVRRVL